MGEEDGKGKRDTEESGQDLEAAWACEGDGTRERQTDSHRELAVQCTAHRTHLSIFGTQRGLYALGISGYRCHQTECGLSR